MQVTIALGVAANILSALIFAGIALLLSKIIWRRELRTFFGVRRFRKGGIQIRLSCINVQPGGTIGTVTSQRGYSGSAITELEYKYALQLANSIETKPLTRTVRALLQHVTTVEEPLICNIGASRPFAGQPPVDFQSSDHLREDLAKELGEGTFILVGAPIYNLMTNYELSRHGSRFQFLAGIGEPRRGISVVRSEEQPPKDYLRSTTKNGTQLVHTEYFVLQKQHHPPSSTVFVCAGTGTGATVAALTQLKNWRNLPPRIKHAPEFFMLFEATTKDPELEPFEVRYAWSQPHLVDPAPVSLPR